MKILKFCLTVITFILILFEVNGQTYWKINGNSAGPSDFLGTTNNEDLRFRVANTPRMRIMHNGGFVGLGDYTVFTPAAFLHINQPSQHNPSGNLIRTDGEADLDLTWSMYSSMGGGNLEQRARFLLSPNTLTQEWNPLESNIYNDPENHLRIESTLGDIVFRAHGTHAFQGPSGTLAERVRITSVPFNDPHINGGARSTTRVSISSRAENEVVHPLAMLHIGDRWPYQQGGHRQWMNSGTYIQRKSDNVFFGIRPRENTDILSDDFNDAIIAWGDNDTPDRLDALRFVFCGLYSAGADPGQAGHINGLEAMRIHPGGNIGMGDFSVNGLNETPSEKLDVAGKLRVRDVPLNNTPEVLIVGLQVDTIGDYVHNHLPFPGDNSLFLSGTGEWLPGGIGSDCRWGDVVSGTIPGELDMSMGFDPNENCHRGKLGVGIEQNKDAKMQVHNYYDRDSVRVSLLVESRGDWDTEQNFVYGVSANAHGTHLSPASDRQNTYIGVAGMAYEGGYTVGVLGTGGGSYNPIGSYNIGVYATAFDTIGPNGTDIGLYAQGSDYALVAYGAATFTNSPIQLSDESVKTDVQPLDNATEILGQLQPKSYTMVNPEGRDLNFDDDLQFGFLAQDVMPVLPNVVEDFHVPDLLDSTGFVPDTHLNLKGIQYQEFIPLLVAGFQEQQAAMGIQEATIAEQDETIVELQHQLETQAEQMGAQAQRIADLEDDLKQVLTSLQQTKSDVNHCCGTSGATGQSDNGPAVMDGVALEQNVPNPFADQTTIAFDLPDAAVVRVEISDSTGRLLETLHNGRMDTGRHTVTWDAARYPSGVYYYSLYADTALLTKKMIKR